MNSPALPLEGTPVPSAEALALRKIKIGRVSFDELWLAASTEMDRNAITGRLHEQDARRAPAGSAKARMHAEIAEGALKTRDCFFAMCRLVERIKTDRVIVERLRDMADRENAIAQSEDEKALEAAAEAAQERRLNGEDGE